ncbi:MAG: hypothetical protein J7M15_04045 [Anaerolineae bacterium]|nr:hypothetical protein [Anaerolineae bacterium]
MEIVAVLGKSQWVVADGCARIVDRIPFPILQLHADNGSESLNHHLLRFWRRAVPQLEWSESSTNAKSGSVRKSVCYDNRPVYLLTHDHT